MPTVARLPGGITIEQHFREHNPPHFHALHGDDEVLIEIALPMNLYAGNLKPSAISDVMDWAKDHRGELALNWMTRRLRTLFKGFPSYE